MHTPFLNPDNFQMVEQQHWHELQREADNWRLAREARAISSSSGVSGNHLSVAQVLRRKFHASVRLPRLTSLSFLLHRSGAASRTGTL